PPPAPVIVVPEVRRLSGTLLYPAATHLNVGRVGRALGESTRDDLVQGAYHDVDQPLRDLDVSAVDRGRITRVDHRSGRSNHLDGSEYPTVDGRNPRPFLGQHLENADVSAGGGHCVRRVVWTSRLGIATSKISQQSIV